MQFLVLTTITFMSNWTNPAMKKTQLENIPQKTRNATKTFIAKTSLSLKSKMRIFGANIR